MTGKVIIKDDRLFFQRLEVENALKKSDGFHLMVGWYIFPEPLDLNKEVEIKIIDDKSCRIHEQARYDQELN